MLSERLLCRKIKKKYRMHEFEWYCDSELKMYRVVVFNALFIKSQEVQYTLQVSATYSALTVKLYWRQKLAKRFSADDSLPVAVTSFGIVGGILLLLAVAVMHYGSTAVYIERWDAYWRTAAPQAHRQKSSANNLTIVILCSASITRFAFRYDTLLGSRKCRIE